MSTPTHPICSPFLWRRQSPFDSSENFMAPSPRKRMRFPTFYPVKTGIATNVTFQQHKVSREERANVLGRHPGYRGCTLWFTGLSGAGKTTIAFALEKMFIQLGISAYGLDGDNIRHGLCKDLGFSMTERSENIRRVAEVAKLFSDMGVVVLASFISPFRYDRNEARRIHEEADVPFFEIYMNTPIEVCEARDTKKLYEKARAGKIHGFTGVDSVYEPPVHPDLVLNSGDESETNTIQRVLHFLYEKKILPDQVMYQLCGQPIRQLFVFDDQHRDALLNDGLDNCPTIELTLVDMQWLQVLSEGWATPLTGFMRERQYLQCLHFGQLLDLDEKCNIAGSVCGGTEDAICKEDADKNSKDHFPFLSSINQSIPIVLSINDEQKLCIEKFIASIAALSSRKEDDDSEAHDQQAVVVRIRLHFKGRLVGVLTDPEVFPHRKEERVHRQFGHSDRRHPGIQLIMQSGDWLLGGDIYVFERITHGDGLDEYRKTPSELRLLFAERQCDCVFAFQLRNPIHNGHALLMRNTREKLLQRGYRNPMLLLHPLGGWTKDDDVPLKIRIEQHKAVIEEKILDPDWTVLAIFPSPMLYAGPTEVQWHARARLACGVNAYIVGRDPAGIQNAQTGDFLYDPTHGAKVLSMAPALPGMEIIPFRVAAYDKTIGQMAFYDENRRSDFTFISGTMMRKMAREGGSSTPPEGFMSPMAWEIIASYYREQQNKTDDANECGSGSSAGN